MPRIAIIDDDASVRNSIELAFSAHGHAAVAFPNAKQFLATADVSEFDLLLVDNDMPHMTGLELHEWLQGQTILKPKFVLMSGRISEEDFAETQGSPEITLLSKPFPLAKLLQIVNS
jgi:DNA-binding response OmpR family regulator